MVNQPTGPYRNERDNNPNPLQREAQILASQLESKTKYVCGNVDQSVELREALWRVFEELKKNGFKKIFDFYLLEVPKRTSGGASHKKIFSYEITWCVYWANKTNLLFAKYNLTITTEFGRKFVIMVIKQAIKGERYPIKTEAFVVLNDPDLITKIKKLVPLKYKLITPNFYRNIHSETITHWEEIYRIVVEKSQRGKLTKEFLNAIMV